MVQDKMYDEIDTYLDDENITLFGKRSAMSHKDKNGWTPLMFAVVKHVPDSIIEKMIIMGGVEIVSLENKWGNVALIYALAQGKSYDMIRLLVEKGGGGVCIAQRYWEGLTPLHWACKYNSSLEVIQYLVDEGQRYFQESDDYDETLINAMYEFISMKCHQDQTCIHKVCANGPNASLGVLKILLDGCDDPRILLGSDKKKKLPLHTACQENAPLDVIQYLVSLDITKESLKHEDCDGKVPLHLSCVHGGSMEVVTFLANVGGKETIQSIPYRVRRLTHRGVLLSYKSYATSSSSSSTGGKHSGSSRPSSQLN